MYEENQWEIFEIVFYFYQNSTSTLSNVVILEVCFCLSYIIVSLIYMYLDFCIEI